MLRNMSEKNKKTNKNINFRKIHFQKLEKYIIIH